MRIFTNKYITIVILSLLLTACAFYPKVTISQHTGCELVTKRLTIDGFIGGIPDVSGCDHLDCILVIWGGAAIIGIVSFVVAGSVVITGNTVHWIEQQGKCDDGVINQAVNDLSNSLLSIGGWIVNSKDDLLNWLNLIISQQQELQVDSFCQVRNYRRLEKQLESNFRDFSIPSLMSEFVVSEMRYDFAS